MLNKFDFNKADLISEDNCSRTWSVRCRAPFSCFVQRGMDVGKKPDQVIEHKEEDRAVPSFKDYPMAPEDSEWSFSAEEENEIIEEFGWAGYSEIHAWYEEKGSEVKSDYKLPFAKLYNGEIHVFWRDARKNPGNSG